MNNYQHQQLLRSSNKHGFTLVETMVVVIILMIIAGVAIPSYTNYVKRAQVANVISFLGQYIGQLIDIRSTTGTWPSSFNNTVYPTPSTNVPANINATNFFYGASNNSAWIGFKLSANLGGGWIFMLTVEQNDGTFKKYCGSWEVYAGCSLGICNKQQYLPDNCNSENISVLVS